MSYCHNLNSIKKTIFCRGEVKSRVQIFFRSLCLRNWRLKNRSD